MSQSSMHSNCRIRLDVCGFIQFDAIASTTVTIETNVRQLNGNASIHLRISSFYREFYQFRMHKFQTKMIENNLFNCAAPQICFYFLAFGNASAYAIDVCVCILLVAKRMPSYSPSAENYLHNVIVPNICSDFVQQR